MYKEVRLKKGKEAPSLRFHPWIFSGAIESVSDNIAEGETVKVIDSEGKTIGFGDWQIGSIAVRLISFGNIAIDEDFLMKKITDAIILRKKLGLLREDNDICRLIHGEGDFLPGLIVDLYGSTAVVQAHSPGMHYRRMLISRILQNNGVLNVKSVFYKSESTLPYKADLGATDGYLTATEGDFIAHENGLNFHIDWLRGQKTGFFIDQRENRHLLERYSEGKRVLNMFCYTGGFSVYALRGKAEKVVSVDSSAKAIAVTEENVKMNFGPEIVNKHEAVIGDAFTYIDNVPKNDFDLIVLDPPAFAKHRKALTNALRGYQRLNAKAIKKIAPGGLLFTFSCSQAVNKEQFRLSVFSAAAESGRKVRILNQLTQPDDHPINIYHPEGEYLKGLVLYVE